MNRRWTGLRESMVILTVVLAASATAWGQTPDTGTKASNLGNRAPAPKAPAPPAEPGPGAIALENAAKANQYAFIFFFRADDEPTRKCRAALEPAVQEMPDKAAFIAVDVTDAAETGTVKKYGVGRAPMPLILAVAPSGAVTKNWLRTFDAAQIAEAFVSPSEEKCLAALQKRKMVLVCVQNEKTTHNDEAMLGVNEFGIDPQYAAQIEIVTVDPAVEAEAGFLQKLKVNPQTAEAITVLMAPPGRSLATFTGATNKADIVAATKQAAAGCAPGGKCAPGSKCGPGGKCGPAPKKPAETPAETPKADEPEKP